MTALFGVITIMCDAPRCMERHTGYGTLAGVRRDAMFGGWRSRGNTDACKGHALLIANDDTDSGRRVNATRGT